ncbi:MAG TPA: serine/threonine-protein kinase, partial [Polyangiaceae bacterium]
MTSPVNEGDVLAGKYRVDKVLGVGGMGVVVAAHHIQLDEKVAIKFLLPEMLVSKEAVGRFAREARAAVKIKSEHVARVSDVGTLENGAPYMVMEYLQGEDLAAWVQRQGSMPFEQAIEFVLQACEALAEAHSLGIVHRDLKPANLFVIRAADGLFSVKVLDFGISKMKDLGGSGSDMSMTKTATVMGSPFYMSPEQMESAKNADSRADIWAIGVILYELVTGRLPFEAEALPELVVKVLTASPPPIRNFRPDAPLELQEIISKCLERDRNQRYANVAELASALGPLGPKRSRESVERIGRVIQHSGLSVSGPSVLDAAPDSEVDSRPRGGTMGAWGQTAPGANGGGRKTALLAAGGMLLVLVVGAAGYMARGAHAPDAATAAAMAQPAPEPSHVPAAAAPPAVEEEPQAAPTPVPTPVTAVPAPVAAEQKTSTPPK